MVNLAKVNNDLQEKRLSKDGDKDAQSNQEAKDFNKRTQNQLKALSAVTSPDKIASNLERVAEIR